MSIASSSSSSCLLLHVVYTGSAEADEQAAWWASPNKSTPRYKTGNGTSPNKSTPRYKTGNGASPMRSGGSYRIGKGGASGTTPRATNGVEPPFSPAATTPRSNADTSYFMHRFHVRVLVPCYKEDLAVIASTVQVWWGGWA